VELVWDGHGHNGKSVMVWLGDLKVSRAAEVNALFGGSLYRDAHLLTNASLFLENQAKVKVEVVRLGRGLWGCDAGAYSEIC